jgi:hypothetical protein
VIALVLLKEVERDYPTNITAIKYFEKAKEEDFTNTGVPLKIFICCF